MIRTLFRQFATKVKPTPAAVASPTPAATSDNYAISSTKTSLKHLLSLENQAITQSFIEAFIPKYYSSPVTGLKPFPVTPTLALPTVDFEPCCRFLVESRNIKANIVEVDVDHSHGVGELSLFKLCTSYVSQLTVPIPHIGAEASFKGIHPFVSVQIHDYNEPDTISQSTTTHEIHLVEDDFIKHYSFQDIYTGDSIDALQIIEIDLPRARKYLMKKRHNYDLFNDTDWWLELLSNSSNYNNIGQTYLNYPIPLFFSDAIDKLNMTHWSPALRSSYLNEVVVIKSVKVYKRDKEGKESSKKQVIKEKAIEDVAVRMLGLNYNREDIAKVSCV